MSPFPPFLIGNVPYYSRALREGLGLSFTLQVYNEHALTSGFILQGRELYHDS